MKLIPITDNSMLPIPDGCKDVRRWLLGECKVMRSLDDGILHLSISHPERYPTWDEIKEARERLLPLGETFAMIFPPVHLYVNEHPNCFHLFGLERRDVQRIHRVIPVRLS